MKANVAAILLVLVVVSCERSTDGTKEPVAPAQIAGEPTGANSANEVFPPDVYEHHQTLLFDPSGYETKVLTDPLSNETVYIVQKGDKIVVSNVLEYRSLKKTFIKVTTPSGQVGYIQIGWNPYQNGAYSFQESIIVDGMEIKILNISENFDVSDGFFIKSLPSEKSENLHEITHSEGGRSYQVTAITSDYKWVKITLGQYVGWVPANALSVGRGGPTINTPEAVISFDLIYSNQI